MREEFASSVYTAICRMWDDDRYSALDLNVTNDGVANLEHVGRVIFVIDRQIAQRVSQIPKYLIHCKPVYIRAGGRRQLRTILQLKFGSSVFRNSPLFGWTVVNETVVDQGKER